MAYFIKELILSEGDFQKYYIYDYDNTAISPIALKNLSKLNIFVGSNNSGKSRFMRGISKIANYTFIPTNSIKSIVDLIHEYQNEVQTFLSGLGIMEYGDVVASINKISIPGDTINSSTAYAQELYTSFEKLNSISGSPQVSYPGGRSSPIYDDTTVQAKLREIVTKYKELANRLMPNKQLKYDFHKIYIPTLRGLRIITETQATDLYHARTHKDYFDGLTGNNSVPEIFTGQSMYMELQRMLLGDLKSRKLAKEFELFLGESFFNGQDVALIPRLNDSGKKDIFIKIGKEEERPIYSLGDGIQQIIILTFPLYKYKDDNLLVFIEEPELYLHAGMQRILLNQFSKLGNHQIFITTHSNHLLDLTLNYINTSIYTFKKRVLDEDTSEITPEIDIQNVNNSDKTSLLLLGVQNSSVFLTNSTIWVEGITDRLYIQKYLEVFQKHLLSEREITEKELYKEDIHYSFVEYGGSNITHWSFLDDPKFDPINIEWLCAKSFLVADKDESEWKKERLEKLSEKLADRFFPLGVIEIENTLSKTVLLNTVADLERKEASMLNSKFSDTDSVYKETRTGKFIEEVVMQGQSIRRKYVERDTEKKISGSGTLLIKLEFCKKAVGYIKNFNDLSEEAKQMCEKMYLFIKSENTKLGY
jgi:predicted ATP-dependent endonuclease of OLD family